MSTEHTGSSSLFAIFALSIYSLFLIPYTIYHVCNGEEEQGGQQIWVQGKNKKKGISKWMEKSLTKGNLIVLGLWLLWALLLWYVNVSSKELKQFDPFEILGIPRGSGDREIKKAYRQLSLKFHPDKNPDPKANAFFTEFITKAYQALTDEVSRKNYEEFGHPDGRQSVNVGVALPEWIFTQDKSMAPVMLLGLVGCGILLPLILASWYMLSSNKYVGPNGIMNETLAYYYHSKYSIKESQSLVRIPETLVCAMEFINMATPNEQAAAFDDLRKLTLRHHPDLKEKPLFWKRKASVVKAHMLVLMHLERAKHLVPAGLLTDLNYVLTKTPALLEEMMKIAVLPRPPTGQAWLTPSVAVVEMMQCVAQGVSVEVRKTQLGKPVDPAAVLMQLPHFDADVIKKLKRRRITTLKELQDLDEATRTDVLTSACGLNSEAARDTATFVAALPAVHARATCTVEDEEEIMEQDIVKCKVRVLLTRPAHNSGDFAFQAKGKAVRAITPLLPAPREEAWYVLLADMSSNSVYANARVSLQEAEAAGYERPEVGDDWAAVAAGEGAGGKAALATASKFISRYSSGLQHRNNTGAAAGSKAEGGAVVAYSGAEGATNTDDVGQLVELVFQAPKAGKYELQVLLLSDSYIGCDRSVPVRLKVTPLTRAAAEGRDAKSQAKNADGDDDVSQGDAGSKADSDEEDEDDGGSGEWDSDESGDEETEDEDAGAREAELKAKEEAKRIKRREGKAAARAAAATSKPKAKSGPVALAADGKSGGDDQAYNDQEDEEDEEQDDEEEEDEEEDDPTA